MDPRSAPGPVGVVRFVDVGGGFVGHESGERTQRQLRCRTVAVAAKFGENPTLSRNGGPPALVPGGQPGRLPLRRDYIPRGKGRFAPGTLPEVTQLVLHLPWRNNMRSFERRTFHPHHDRRRRRSRPVAAGCGSDSDSSSHSRRPRSSTEATDTTMRLDRRSSRASEAPARPMPRRRPTGDRRDGPATATHRVAQPDAHRDHVRHRCRRPARRRRRLLQLPGRGARTPARAVGLRAERRGDRRVRARPRVDRRRLHRPRAHSSTRSTSPGGTARRR